MTPFSQGADVWVIVGNLIAYQGTSNNGLDVSLVNNYYVRGLQFDIYDEDDYMECESCECWGRSSGFTCEVEEQSTGACKILLFGSGGETISPGSGTVVTINFYTKETAPRDQCRNIWGYLVKAVDSNRQHLTGAAVVGEVCFENQGCLAGCCGFPGGTPPDCKVSAWDYGQFVLEDGTNLCDGNCLADFNGDNRVSAWDYGIFKLEDGRMDCCV